MALKKNLYSSVFIFFILLLAGCASVPDRQSSMPQNSEQAPLWITADVSSSYNEKEYLTALGEGSSGDSARSDALNLLTQYFDTKVHSEGLAIRSTINSSFSSSSEQFISVKSKANLFCVEYDEYYDRIQNRYYSLAFINRLKAFNFVKPSLENSRMLFPQAYYNSLQKDCLLDKIIGIRHSWSVLPDFYEVYNFARAIMPERAKAYEEVDALAKESVLSFKELCTSVLIKIQGTGDTALLENSEIIAELSNQLTNMGFTVGNSQKVNCIALVEVKSAITETRETFQTYPEISIKILEKGKEKITYTKKLSKVAGFDKETVIRRTNIALTEDIKNSFVNECF